MNKFNHKWFTRHHGEIKGPFTIALLKSNLQLGRLSVQDEVSADKLSWRPLSEIMALDLQQRQFQQVEKAEKAKRFLDERDGHDRREHQLAAAALKKQRKLQRRAREPEDIIRQRQLRTRLLARYRQHHEPWFWSVTITVLLIITIAVTAILFPTKLPISNTDCNAAPDSGINWENCNKAGVNLAQAKLNGANLRNIHLTAANLMNVDLSNTDLMYADLRLSNLSYADLSDAKLKGANLQQADLSYSILKQADLSFTDLTGATIGGGRMQQTRLDNAIWIDGSVCAPGSIDVCHAVPMD